MYYVYKKNIFDILGNISYYIVVIIEEIAGLASHANKVKECKK